MRVRPSPMPPRGEDEGDRAGGRPRGGTAGQEGSRAVQRSLQTTRTGACGPLPEYRPTPSRPSSRRKRFDSGKTRRGPAVCVRNSSFPERGRIAGTPASARLGGGDPGEGRSRPPRRAGERARRPSARGDPDARRSCPAPPPPRAGRGSGVTRRPSTVVGRIRRFDTDRVPTGSFPSCGVPSLDPRSTTPLEGAAPAKRGPTA